MHAKQHFYYAMLLSLAVLVLTFIIPIIPCEVTSSAPVLDSTWSLCLLNPDHQEGFEVTKKFWGYTSSLTSSYLVTFAVVFVLTLLFFHAFSKKRKKGK